MLVASWFGLHLIFSQSTHTFSSSQCLPIALSSRTAPSLFGSVITKARAEISYAVDLLRTAAGESRRQFSGERADRRLHIGEIVGGCVHEIDVLDQGPPQCPGDGLPTPIGHETPSDLLLDLLTHPLDQGIHLLSQ